MIFKYAMSPLYFYFVFLFLRDWQHGLNIQVARRDENHTAYIPSLPQCLRTKSLPPIPKAIVANVNMAGESTEGIHGGICGRLVSCNCRQDSKSKEFRDQFNKDTRSSFIMISLLPPLLSHSPLKS